MSNEMKLTRLEIVRALKIGEKREYKIWNKLYKESFECSDYDELEKVYEIFNK